LQRLGEALLNGGQCGLGLLGSLSDLGVPSFGRFRFFARFWPRPDSTTVHPGVDRTRFLLAQTDELFSELFRLGEPSPGR